MDEGAPENALIHLENTLAQCAHAWPGIRQSLFGDAAFSSALLRSNATQAREWLKRTSNLGGHEPFHAGDAAIPMCERRYADALEHWAKAYAYAERRKLGSGGTG